MCGRFSIFNPQPEIEQRFGAEATTPIVRRYNVAPQSDIPVIQNTAPHDIKQTEWGMVAPWDDSKRLINARAESAAEKRTFREAFHERRCLVIADGYYEWQEQPKGPKQPYRIQREDAEPFAFAGLWNEANGYPKPTCTILTTEPSPAIEHIHDRMPVMLTPDSKDRWLGKADPDELQSMLGPYSADDLEAYPISTKVNDPSYDEPDIILQEDTEQSGLGQFS